MLLGKPCLKLQFWPRPTAQHSFTTPLGLELNSQHLQLLALWSESSVRYQGTTLVGTRTLVLEPDLRGPCWLPTTAARFTLRPCFPFLFFFVCFRNFGLRPVCPVNREQGKHLQPSQPLSPPSIIQGRREKDFLCFKDPVGVAASLPCANAHSPANCCPPPTARPCGSDRVKSPPRHRP